MRTEIDDIKNELIGLKWNNRNLRKHTKKHPIDESKHNIKDKEFWENKLEVCVPLDDKSPDFIETMNRYKEVSTRVLSNLENVIIYYNSNDNYKSNGFYRSIGLFENKDYKYPDRILVTHVQADFSDKIKPRYYITTCFSKKLTFTTKFYFLYKVLEEPETFKYNLDKNNFLNKFGIPKNANLNKLHQLILEESLIDEDEIGNIFYNISQRNRLNCSDFNILKYMFDNNEYICEIKKNDNKIKVNKEIIGCIDEMKKECVQGERKYNLYDLEKIFKCANELYDEINIYRKKENIKIYKCGELKNNIMSETKLNRFIKSLYNKNYDKEQIRKMICNCVFTFVFMCVFRNKSFDNLKEDTNFLYNIYNNKQLYKCSSVIIFLDSLKKYIECINIELYNKNNHIEQKMEADDEFLINNSLIKAIASQYSDYIKSDFEISHDFINKYDYNITDIISNNLKK